MATEIKKFEQLEQETLLKKQYEDFRDSKFKLYFKPIGITRLEDIPMEFVKKLYFIGKNELSNLDYIKYVFLLKNFDKTNFTGYMMFLDRISKLSTSLVDSNFMTCECLYDVKEFGGDIDDIAKSLKEQIPTLQHIFLSKDSLGPPISNLRKLFEQMKTTTQNPPPPPVPPPVPNVDNEKWYAGGSGCTIRLLKEVDSKNKITLRLYVKTSSSLGYLNELKTIFEQSKDLNMMEFFYENGKMYEILKVYEMDLLRNNQRIAHEISRFLKLQIDYTDDNSSFVLKPSYMAFPKVSSNSFSQLSNFFSISKRADADSYANYIKNKSEETIKDKIKYTQSKTEEFMIFHSNCCSLNTKILITVDKNGEKRMVQIIPEENQNPNNLTIFENTIYLNKQESLETTIPKESLQLVPQQMVIKEEEISKEEEERVQESESEKKKKELLQNEKRQHEKNMKQIEEEFKKKELYSFYTIINLLSGKCDKIRFEKTKISLSDIHISNVIPVGITEYFNIVEINF